MRYFSFCSVITHVILTIISLSKADIQDIPGADKALSKLATTKKPIPVEKKYLAKLTPSEDYGSSSTSSAPTFSNSTPVDVHSAIRDVPYSTTTELLDIDLTPPPNANVTQEEDHKYYNSTLYQDPGIAQRYWVDLDDNHQAVVHDMLSNSYRRAATVQLSFDFPFYGHALRNVTLATGGFIYMGLYVHTWLAATQYIAPLMGNFDTTLTADAAIRFADNGTAFTVEWKDVVLKDKIKDNASEEGFTFQATLFSNGDVVFVYRKVPVPITEINNISHPVKVGLADAYTIDKTFFHIKKKTIYEYHRIDLKSNDISNNTVIYFTAALTCMRLKDCNSCLTADLQFECQWCEQVKRCSDGLDRHRQDWLLKNCHNTKSESCSGSPEITSSTFPSHSDQSPPADIPSSSALPTFAAPEAHKALISGDDEQQNSSNGMTSGGLVALLMFLGIVTGLSLWIFYAYRYPQTASGQCLIRYRPSQWRFRHGEARYTAASIHM